MDTTKEKICPKCKTANPIAANFCRHCGEMFQSALITKNENENENENNSLLDALRKKIISLQEEIKEYDERERLWQIKARNWFDKENIEKTQNEKLQKEIDTLKLERNLMRQDEFKRNQTSPQRFTYTTVIIFIVSICCSFFLGYLSHKESPQNDNDIPIEIKEIVETEKSYPIPTDFVLVPGGVLSYDGNYYECGKKHRAEMDSFYICKFELTQGEYKRVMGSLDKDNCMWLIENSWYREKGPEYSEVIGDSIPVRGNLRLFAKYCNSRSKQEGYDGFYEINGDDIKINPEGNGYRLITPYEWIFAAYGGNLNKKDKYLGGNNLSEVAWHYGNSKRKPHAVGLKKPNVIGLYDIQGNARELLQGDDRHRCYGSMYGGYNVSNWNYAQAYDPTYIWYLNNDESKWTYGTRIAFIPKNIKNDNLKIKYNYE